MAAIPTILGEGGRRSSSSNSESSKSFGRGGAGNVRPKDSSNTEPVNLDTPNMKNDYYTTGHGGSGNMAGNVNQEEARRAQDLIDHPLRESHSRTHVGRGGVANISTQSQDEVAAAKLEYAKWESAFRNERKGTRHKGLADKGKEWLFGIKDRKS